MLSKVFLIVMRVHAAAFEEEPQLTSSLMLEMVELLQLLSEVEHAWRIKPLPKSFDILYVKFELAVNSNIVEVGRVQCVQRLT